MGIVVYIIIAILALSALVFFHELGHFIVARVFGVKVERFSIGFGKVLLKKEWAGTEWVVAPILFGGYIKMKGQDDTDPLQKSKKEIDSYNSKKPWQRIIILFAGPLANILLAFFIYLFIALHGVPIIVASDFVPTVVGKIMPNSPASISSIDINDKILKVNNQKVKYWYELGEAIQKASDPICLTILRDDKKINLTLKAKTEDRTNQFNEKIKRRVIGIIPKIDKKIINFDILSALKYAYYETKKATFMIAKGVEKIYTGDVDSKNISGAITIFDILMKFAQKGYIYLLFIMALLSVNLGVINLLPIPALDGGHIVFNLYEMITRKEPSENVIYILTILGWIFLISLMVFGMYNDINRIWGAK